jgi:flagellar hook-length control protein FliK
VRDPRWAEGLAERVSWLVREDRHSARLRLDPPDLGPLEVRIELTADGGSVQFTAAHPAVREALESALPRLREMLGAQGLPVLDLGVSQQGTGQREQPDGAPGRSQAGPPGALARSLHQRIAGGSRQGLFDGYA